MGTRAYRRDSNGKFAGAGGGTKVTYGKAGGFANAAFRARTAGQKASPNKSLGATAGAKGPRRSFTVSARTQKRVGAALGTGAALAAVGAVGSRGRSKRGGSGLAAAIRVVRAAAKS